MARKSEHHQPGLFDEETPLVKPCPARRVELAGLVEALLHAGEARAVGDELAEWVDRGKPVTRRQPDDLFSSIELLRVVLLFCALAGAFSSSLGRQFPPCNPGRPKS
jgi:hypothetical protein